jgi:cell division protease FtsH
VRKIVTEQYERARRILEENRDTMVRLAEALLEHESLDGVQIRRIVAGFTIDDREPLASDAEELPQVKEPTQGVLKPILPPITGGNPAPA